MSIRRWMAGSLVGAVTAVLVSLGVLTASPASAAPCPAEGGFGDVPVASVFCTDIAWLASRGIAQGYDDGGFHPNATVTRQAMAAFLARYDGAAPAACTSAPFPDVPADHPFCAEIAWLAGEGISGGYADGGFHPTAVVTRQAMAAFLARLAAATTSACTGPAFPDVPAGHPFCAEIAWLAGQGVTGGYGDGGFHPTAVVTRQAMAAFIHRSDDAAACQDQTQVPVAECAGLRALYQAAGGNSWDDQGGWMTNEDVCTWDHVTCSLGHVTALNFYGDGIVGAIPAEIGNLTGLEAAYFDDNELAYLSPGIGKLTHLTYLNLGGNQLTSVPATIGELTGLTSLYLGGNELTAVPSQIGNLTSLNALSLSDNHLTALPASIGQLHDMERLFLAGNDLTGVPDVLWDLTQLEFLYLDGNQLAVLPTAVGNLENLVRLTLSDNELHSLPAEVGSLTGLTTFQVDGNHLSGDITAWAEPLSENSAIVPGFPASDLLLIGDGISEDGGVIDVGNNCLSVPGQPAVVAWLDARDPSWDECV